MTNSNTIYANAIEGVEDQHLVYVLYRDDGVPHYVGATSNPKRPYSNQHHARVDYNITSVEIVQESLSLEDASILEDRLINHYGRVTEDGTLVNQRGGGCGLVTHSEETKTKLSTIAKGRSHTEDTKLKIGQASRGRQHNDEVKAKISVAMKGRTPSEETRAKLSTANKGRKRKPFTEEHKAKLSANAKARKRSPMSEETKAKLRASWSRRKSATLK